MASLTPQLAAVIGALAGERREVAARWGIRDVPPDPTWLAGAFDEVGRALHRLGGGAARIRIEDLAAGSLVPLSSAAAAVGVAIPATNALIEIVSTMLDFDARAAGRRLDAMGLASTDLDRIRRATTTAGAG